MAESFGVGLVVTRLREALRLLSDDQLRESFKNVDSDGSGELGASELKKALFSLGFKVSPNELEEVMEYFDTDGNGSVSIDEFVDFAGLTSSDDPAADGDGKVSSVVNRVRAALIAFGDDSLSKLFEDENGQLHALTAVQLHGALRRLGVPNLTQKDVDSLLRRMDENGDGSVTCDELSAFLRQKAFAEGVRKVMARCSAVLRAQGTSLQNALVKVARREAAAAAKANGKGLVSALSHSTGIPVVTTAGLERLLVTQLGFPLSPAQLSAIICMADMDGSGDCDLEEILYLAGEEYEEEGEIHTQGGESDSEGSISGPLAKENDASKESVAMSKLEAACGVRILSLTSVPGGDFYDTDDYFCGRDDCAAQLYGPLGEVESASPSDASVSLNLSSSLGGVTLLGRSGLEGIPASAFQPDKCPSPSEMWAAIVSAAFQGVAVISPSGAPGVGPVLDASRAHMLLAALGLQLPATVVRALLAKQATEGAPQTLDVAAFLSLVDAATMLAHDQGRSGLPPCAETRVLLSLRTFAVKEGMAGAREDGVMSRHAFAVALLHVPGAGLTPAEALSVAAHVPGSLQPRALALVHSHLGRNAAEAGGRTKAALSSLAMAGSGLYPSDISMLHLSSCGPGVGAEPDVSIPRAVTWLKLLATGGACVTLCDPPGPGSDGIERFHRPVSLAFGGLDPVARSGVRKLCGGAVSLPCPINLATMPPATASAGSMAFTATFTSSFLLLSPRLPASFRPSCLAQASYAHPWLALSRKTLLDGGWEADPGNIYDHGRAMSVAVVPGSQAASVISASSTAPGGVHPLMVTSFTTAAGQGADGFGLTLRMASVLPGSEEVKAGCVPSFAVPDKSTILRPLGAIGAPSDSAWAAEGAAVRSLPMLLTAVVTLSGGAAIPIPRDDSIRASIAGRLVRVALADIIAPNPGDITGVPRFRLISNAIAVPATWAASAEDVWSFPDASPFSKLVLRSDQPRDGAGPAAAVVLIELNILLAHPQEQAGAARASAAAAMAATLAADTAAGSATPYAPSPLVSPYVADVYPYEEVTVAWGAIPLSVLASEKADSTVRLPLVGGSPGAEVEVHPSDILQRRSGLSALSMAVAGAAATPTLTLSVTRLARMRKGERQMLARLPMTIVTPLGWAPALEAFRRLYAERTLPSLPSMARAQAAPLQALFPAGAVFQSVLSMPGPGGNASALSALLRTVDAEFAAVKRATGGTTGAPSFEAVLSDVVFRAWAVACSEGASAAPLAEAAERAFSGSALAQLLQAQSIRPVSAVEQLA